MSRDDVLVKFPSYQRSFGKDDPSTTVWDDICDYKNRLNAWLDARPFLRAATCPYARAIIHTLLALCEEAMDEEPKLEEVEILEQLTAELLHLLNDGPPTLPSPVTRAVPGTALYFFWKIFPNHQGSTLIYFIKKTLARLASVFVASSDTAISLSDVEFGTS